MGDHGLGLLVVVGLVGDLRLESGRVAAAGEGLGDRVVVGAGDPGIVREVREGGRRTVGQGVVLADEEGRGSSTSEVTTMSSRSMRFQS